jgi:hypothetical protein
MKDSNDMERDNVERILRGAFPVLQDWRVADWHEAEFRDIAENFHMIGTEDNEVLPKLMVALLYVELDNDWGLVLDDLAIVLDVEAHAQHEYVRKLKEQLHSDWTDEQCHAIYTWLDFMAKSLGRLTGERASDEDWANALRYWKRRAGVS